MILYINQDISHPITVHTVSRELVANGAGKRQIFIRIAIDENFDKAIEYCNTYVAEDITLLQLYNGEELVNSYSIVGRVNSIHEVVENNSQEVTMLIDY